MPLVPQRSCATPSTRSIARPNSVFIAKNRFILVAVAPVPTTSSTMPVSVALHRPSAKV